MKSTHTNEIQTTGLPPVAIRSASPPHQRILCLAMAALAGLAIHAQASTFEVGGGPGTIGNSPLTVSAGVATLPASGGYWAAAGCNSDVAGGTARYSSLTSQTLTVANDGDVILKFKHRYDFADTTYDGGAIFVSVNGGAFTYLDGSAFTSNGYTGDTSASVVFGGNKACFSGGDGTTEIESIANLGTFTVGQTIAVTFRGGWDWSWVQAPPPDWEIRTVELSDSASTLLNVDFLSGPSGFTVTNDPTSNPPASIDGPWIYDNQITCQFELDATNPTPSADKFVPSTPGAVINLDNAKLKVVVLNGSLSAGQTFTLFDLSGGSTLAGHYSSIELPQVSWDLSGLEPGGNGQITALSGLYWEYTWNKATAAGTYDWESANWTHSPTDPAPATAWPDGAGTSVICNTQAGTNVWNITSPSITIGSLHLGGDVGAYHTLSGAGKTLVFDNGTSHASLTRGTDISTTTGAEINVSAITLNSTLDIDITSHLTSVLTISSAIGGTGGLNIINAWGDNTWPGLILSGANTYTGDTVINVGDYTTRMTLTNTSSTKFKITDAGSNKITGTGTAVLNGSFNIDTSAVTVTAGSWTLVDVAAKTYGSSFSVTGFTKSGSVWTKTDGARTWIFNQSTGVLALPAAWITSFTYGIAVGSIDQDARTISLIVPNGTNPASVNPTFTLYSGTCTNQTSGSPPSPTFAVQNPATYTITDSSAGITRVYTVTLTVAPPAPGGVAANLALWLDASDASTMTLSGTTTVTEWRDKFGGTGKVSATGEPTLVAAGIGGIPTVHFNTSSYMNDGVNRASGPLTIFLVARETGGSNARVLSAAGNNWLMGYHGNQYNRFFFEGWVNEGGMTSDTNPHLHAATLDVIADTYTVYANGVQVASNNGGSQGPNNLQLNGSMYGEYSDCDISEVVVYDRVLTAGELNSVGAYLATKYGLTTSYPGTAEIVSFGIPGYDGVIDQDAKTIVLSVPIGTVSLATLAPNFTVFSGTCIDQTSGFPPSPTFAVQNPATYTIRDGSVTNTYTVTVMEVVPPYTWIKATPPGSYDWESENWDRPGYPDAAGTAVTCNTQAGANIWSVTSPTITIGSLAFGGDGGAAHTLNGASSTLIFDNGPLHATLSRGDVSTTTGASMTFDAITLNSTLDINITSHITSQLSITASIGGHGGLNITNPYGGDLTWPGLVLTGTHTYEGDTTINAHSFLTIPSGSSIQSNVILNGGTISLGAPSTLTSQHAFVGGSITGTGDVYTEGNVSFDDDTNAWQGRLSLKGNFPPPIQFTSIKDIGTGPSALGNPQDASQGTIVCVGGTSTFEYIGTGDSTDRVFYYSGFGDLDWGVTIKASGTTTVESPFKITSSLGGGTPSWLYLGGTGAGEWAGELGSNANRIKKIEAGTWTLSGTNTYTGDTQVNAGTLILGETGSLNFVVTNSANNKITGAGTVVLNGTFVIDTSAVTSTTGSWTLVNVGTLSETYGSSFTVTDFTPGAGNVWTRVETLPDLSTRTWVFHAATGVLNIADPTAKDMSNVNFPGAGYGLAYPANAAGTNWVLQVLHGTPVNPLSPTFTISDGASCDYPSGTARNFTTTRTYRVTAVDASYQDCTVTVEPYANYEAKVMASNPLAYWPMHEGKGIIAYNNTSGDHGSYNSSGVSYEVAGPTLVGKNAVSFSGDNVAMRVPNTAPYHPDTAFSVELWVKPGSTSTAGCLASNFTASAAEGRSGWLIYQNTGTAGKYSARLYNHNGNNFSCDLQADIGTVAQWTHLVLTWDDVTKTAKFYKDGAIAATSAVGITYFGSLSGDPMSVGMRSDSNYEWSGAACGLAFYNRVLTAEEIANHLVPVPASPYMAWAATFPGFTDTDPAHDPDGDGQNNLLEFAFNGDPTDGARNGRFYSFTGVSGDYPDKVLVLTAAVRTGTPGFVGSPATAVHPTDGIKYTVEGGTNLEDWTGLLFCPTEPITSGLPLDPETGLPVVAGDGYEFRSIILDSSNGLLGKGFLRAKVEPSP